MGDRLRKTTMLFFSRCVYWSGRGLPGVGEYTMGESHSTGLWPYSGECVKCVDVLTTYLVHLKSTLNFYMIDILKQFVLPIEMYLNASSPKGICLNCPNLSYEGIYYELMIEYVSVHKTHIYNIKLLKICWLLFTRS